NSTPTATTDADPVATPTRMFIVASPRLAAMLAAAVRAAGPIALAEGAAVTKCRRIGSRGGAPSHALDARAADPAVAAGILRQILLVIVLRVIERRRIGDFGRDVAETVRLQISRVTLSRALGRFALRIREHVDRRSI